MDFLEHIRNSRLSARDLLDLIETCSMPIALVSSDDARVRMLNTAFRKTFGFEQRQLPEVSEMLAALSSDDEAADRFRGVWGSAGQAGGERVVALARTQAVLHAWDGMPREVEMGGALLRPLGLTLLSFCMTATDEVNVTAGERFATEDYLTGLPNRFELERRWAQDVDRRGEGAERVLLVAGVDGLRGINERFGHSVGDDVLIEMGDRLRRAVRGCDFVCRLGGDEFGVLVCESGVSEHLPALCTRLIENVWPPGSQARAQVKASLSVGAAAYPLDGLTFEAAYAAAERSLARCKQLARGSWYWGGAWGGAPASAA